MSTTKIDLDRYAVAKEFDFGTTSASGEALVTLHKGTASASTVVLDVKGSQIIDGDLEVNGTIIGGVATIIRDIQLISSSQVAGSASLTDYIYLVSGTTTLTLPTAVGNSNNYSVKNTGVAVVSIATTAGQTIDGTASPITMPISGMSLDIVSDGSNWNII